MKTSDTRLSVKNALGHSLTGLQYQTHEMVTMLYRASHKKGDEQAKQWLLRMQLKLERLTTHRSGKISCKTVERYFKYSLQNFIRAVATFKALYKSNCPMAGILPSPTIKSLDQMSKQAKLALHHIQV